MKKGVLVVASLGVFILILSLFFLYYDDSKMVFENSESNSVMRSNAITMMYETAAGSGKYQVTSDSAWPQSGYTFNEELSKCENGGILTWNEESKKVLMQANASDKCYVYFDKTPNTLASYIVNNIYTGTDGDNGLYYHDGIGTYTNATQEAGDNSYRYAGANPNNYICFGSDEASCPGENLYRIIGVFDNQVKLIKYDYTDINILGEDGSYFGSTTSLGEYYIGKYSTLYRYTWNSNNYTNTWSESNLNTVNLNQNYLNALGSKWSNLIATTSWKVGGNTYQNIRTVVVKTAYMNEIESPVEATTYSAKIGLMYVSDYGYAASPENWGTSLVNYNNDTNRNNNWMFMGWYDWSITRQADNNANLYGINPSGEVSNYNSAGIAGICGVRPVFYLNSDVLYDSGDGSQENPYRIE